MHSLLHPQEYMGAYQSSTWTYLFSNFPFNILVILLSSPPVYLLLEAVVVLLPLTVFDDCPWGKFVSHRVSSESDQIKTTLWVIVHRASRESPDRSNNNNFLGMGLGWNSSPVLFSLAATRLLVFTAVSGCCFSKLPWSWGWNGNRTS